MKNDQEELHVIVPSEPDEKKSDKAVYYEEVLSFSGLALSNSKSSEAKENFNKETAKSMQTTRTRTHHNSHSHSHSHSPAHRNAHHNERNSEEVSSPDANANGLAKEDAELLSSLPQRPIANFPSESDRKRVIGMLATIISMTYQYENADVMDYTPDVMSEEEDGHENEDGRFPHNGSDSDEAIAGDDLFDDLWEKTSPVKKESEHGAITPPTSKSKQAKDKSTPKNTKMPRSESTISSSSKKSSSTTRSPSKPKMEDNVTLKRYRRRRYKVYSEFFLLTADLLFLDKSNAIAFLPLLNSLLGSEASNGIEEGPKAAMTPMKGNSNMDKNLKPRKSAPAPSSIARANHKETENIMLREWNHHAPEVDSVSGKSRPITPTQCDDTQENQPWEKNDILLPFVESLETGAGSQCLSLLLLNYLLRSEQGYDARIRACIKKLGVIIYINELKNSDCEEVEIRLNARTKMGKSVDDCLAEMATRKFESLEHTIASKLLRISAAQQHEKAAQEAANKDTKSRGMTRAQIVRSLKIGTAGVAAGTLMAFTGGLAAPGIAAGLAATGITTAVTAGVVTTLTSTMAVTTIFGVGGGSLAAYKTHRRTKGVTEFTFQKQGQRGRDHDEENAELFSTICISGWLKDEKDFERPWGVEPSDPPITDRMEKLIRFYSIHKPSNIGRCQEVLEKWKGEERELWGVLKEKYGESPDELYPMFDSPHRRICLTHEEDEIVDNMLGELGYKVPPTDEKREDLFRRTKDEMKSMDSSINSNLTTNLSNVSSDAEQNQTKTKKYGLSLWDYQMEYGGELFTVKWESDMLVELCDSVADMAADMVGQAAREVLKQTALAVLITAVALPYAIVRAVDMIDGTWTLAIERADLAGIELANSLLESEAGHRPVVLVGFSMGARTIYSCLKELARQQEVWEDYQEHIANENALKKRGIRRGIGKNKKDKNRPKINFTREPASIVEDAIMMGLPNHLSLHSWESCRRIVAGRLVNCYSRNDMILSLMFQIKRLTGALRPVCGTSAVPVRGVENYNVTSLIKAHSDYCTATSHVLRMIYHGCPHRPSATIVIPSGSANYDIY
jgi:hypothetical protein